MFLMHFPVPVSIDDTCNLVVHRDIRGLTHLEERTCWCVPHCFSSEEVEHLTLEQMNAVLRNQVQ